MPSAEAAAAQQQQQQKSNEPDVLHPQHAPPGGRRIYHFEEPVEKKPGATFFDRLFSNCSGKSRRSRSFMIVTEQPAKKQQPEPALAPAPANAEQSSTQRRAMTPTRQMPPLPEEPEPEQQPERRSSKLTVTLLPHDVHPKKLVPQNSIKELSLEQRTDGTDAKRSSAHVVASDTEQTTTTGGFQKNTNPRRSRGSLYYREKASNNNQTSNLSRTKLSSSSERLTSKSTRASAIVSETAGSSNPPGLPTASVEFFEPLPITRPRQSKVSNVASSPERHQKVIHPVEVEEIDISPPSLDPVVITGQQAGQMVNQQQQNYLYSSSNVRRTTSREAVHSSYYEASDDFFAPPQPITATATVGGAATNNFCRSRSMHLRPSHHPPPVAASLTTARASTSSMRRPQPKTNPYTPRCSTMTHQTSRPRSPSPTKPDGATRIQLGCSHDSARQSKRISYAPVPDTRRSETINTCRPRSPGYQPQQQQQPPVYHNARSKQCSPPRQRRCPEPQGVSVPVGSKIDVTMRSNGQLVDESAFHGTSSVRYTYETEFDQPRHHRPPVDDYCQQKPQQTWVPKAHHRAPDPPKRVSSGHYVGPTKVQVGEPGEDFKPVYHSVDNRPKPKPRPQQVETVYQEPVRQRSPSPVHHHHRPTCDEDTPIKEKKVIVSKQVNKRVLEALASSRRKLDQLDTDLDAALRRIQARNNGTPPPPARAAVTGGDVLVSRQTHSQSHSHSQSMRQNQMYAEQNCSVTVNAQPQREYQYGVPLSQPGDLTLHSKIPSRRGERPDPNFISPSSASIPLGSNIVLITIADDGHEERFEENEQIIYSHSPPVREIMVREPPRRVEVKEIEVAKCPGPDQFDFTDKSVKVVSAHGTIGHIFHQLTHGKLPDFVHQRFNVEHSEEEIHNDDVDLVHADGSNIGRIEDFQNLDTIYELINMGIENSQAKVCFKVTCQRIEPVNPRAGVWKRKSVTASRVLNIDLSQNDELKGVLTDIQSAPGESVRMIMAHDVDSSSNVTTREKQLDTRTTAWAVAEILGKAVDQQGPQPISPRTTEDGAVKFLSPSKFAEEVYSNDILGKNADSVAAVPFSTRRGGAASARPWTSQPPPAYRPGTSPRR